jgi:hypothetical protein
MEARVTARYDASDKGIYVRVEDEPAPRSGVASKSSRHAIAGVQAVSDGRGSAIYGEGHSTLAPASLIRGHGDLARWERWDGSKYVTSATLAADGTLDVEDITVQGAAIEGAGPLEIEDIGGLEDALAALVPKATFPVAYGVACSDETTALTTGNGKATFRLPHAMTLTGVRASLTTASTSGTVTVDINEGGTTVLSTALTIDQDEKTSTTATPAVISDATLADDAEIRIDIDGAGTGAAGLKVWLIGTRVIA